MKKRSRLPLSDSVAYALDFPREAISNTPAVLITGKGTVRIEAHRGIIEYGTELISVNCGKYNVAVYGARLILVSMSGYELMIRGDIQRVELE